MSNPYLPPEILDHIADFLHDDPKALKGCCLVSKSWIPRTRKHLFEEVELRHEVHLKSWKKIFSDPSTSPANFTSSLCIGCARAITATDAESGGWLTGFAHVAHLVMGTPGMYPGEPAISLTPFHGLSRTIKSLHIKSIDLPPSRIFDFILSSPLLEDLTMTGYRVWADDGDGSVTPPTFIRSSVPPPLTGSLDLFLKAGAKPIVGQLLSIPGGIHFRGLTLTWHCGEDLSSIIGLVGECSHTLESLNLTCYLDGMSIWYLPPHR